MRQRLESYLQRQRIAAALEEGPDPFEKTLQSLRNVSTRWNEITERVQLALARAQEEAQRFHHDSIDTEHLLLGLVDDRNSPAALVLERLGIDLGQVRQQVEALMTRDEGVIPEMVAFTRRVKQVIEQFAVDEAHHLHHHFLGTEHLLQRLAERNRRRPLCPACGSANPGAFQYCYDCGHRLVSE